MLKHGNGSRLGSVERANNIDVHYSSHVLGLEVDRGALLLNCTKKV